MRALRFRLREQTIATVAKSKCGGENGRPDQRQGLHIHFDQLRVATRPAVDNQ